MSALDRINKLNSNTEKPNLSVDAQLLAANDLENPENEEFFGGMSEEAKESLSKSFSQFEVRIDSTDLIKSDKKEESTETPEESDTEEPVEETKEDEPKDEVKVEEKSDKITAEKESEDNRLFNNNKEESHGKSRGRPRREAKEQSQMSQENSMVDCKPIMDKLVKDLIDDLKKNKYSIGSFSDAEMKIIYDYIYSKL